jgi:uncharacterized protein YhfF
VTLWWEKLDQSPFGDGPELADELLVLILSGRKTATCWSATEGEKGTQVGKQWVVLDGSGRPRAVLETLEFEPRHFDKVDAAFAFEEGEDDRSLAAWRTEHETYFRRNKCFAPNMLLYCERFRLIEILE